jgi:hypothetical protein
MGGAMALALGLSDDSPMTILASSPPSRTSSDGRCSIALHEKKKKLPKMCFFLGHGTTAERRVTPGPTTRTHDRAPAPFLM